MRGLTDYVYFRRNVAGVQREWWYHRFGCELWFLAERDTRTNEVLEREPDGSRAEGRRSEDAGRLMRLPPQPNERIDRSRAVVFSFRGKPVHASDRGDTIGSALFASGRRVFSRSFKYHRPRGLLCCSGHCPNCHDDGRRGAERARLRRAGARGRGGGAAERARLARARSAAVTDKLGGPFTPVGFYYRTMIRPRRLWPLYEKFLRNVAGPRAARQAPRSHELVSTPSIAAPTCS